MARSASLLFPFQEDFAKQSLKRAETVPDTISSAIKAFLITDPGSRRGNPIGSFVPSLKHKTIPSESLITVENELRQELTEQFPGVTFLKVEIIQERFDQINSLRIGITFSTPITDITEFEVNVR